MLVLGVGFSKIVEANEEIINYNETIEQNHITDGLLTVEDPTVLRSEKVKAFVAYCSRVQRNWSVLIRISRPPP